MKERALKGGGVRSLHEFDRQWLQEEDGLWPERRGGLFGRGGFEDEFFHFEQAEINAVENEPDTGTEEREDHERGGSDGAGDSRNRAVDHELVHWLDANDDAC